MELSDYFRFLLALILVIGLILGLALLVRRFGGGGLTTRRRSRRLGVVEATVVDPRRRLVLVRRDGVEHLLLVGGANDLLIEGGIPAPETPATPDGAETPR